MAPSTVSIMRWAWALDAWQPALALKPWGTGIEQDPTCPSRLQGHQPQLLTTQVASLVSRRA